MAIDSLARGMAASAQGGGGGVVDVNIKNGVGIDVKQSGDDVTIANDGVTDVTVSDTTADDGTVKVIFGNKTVKNKHIPVKGINKAAFKDVDTVVDNTTKDSEKLPTTKAVKTALDKKVDTSTIGEANGIPKLDSSKKILVDNLPTHTHTTADVTKLTGYKMAEEQSAVLATDSLNVALGKITKSLSSKQDGGNFAGSNTPGGVANSAAKLDNTTKVGDTTKPVYFGADGKPHQTSYVLEQDVKSDSKLTDTTYEAGTGINISVVEDGDVKKNVIKNTGVTAVADSDTDGANGTLMVTTNGNKSYVAVKGLTSAAFKNVDTTVTDNSANLVTSDAVYEALKNKVNTTDVTDTYSATGTAPVNGKAVKSALDTAIGNLDVSGSSSIASSKTIKSWSETDGKVSIDTQDIAIGGSAVTLTGYEKADTASAVTVTDTVNTAVGKLEKALDGKQATLSTTQMNAVNSGITATLKGQYDTAYTHSQSTHARTDATKVESSTTNGKIKIDGTETTVYTHPGTGTNPHGTTKSDVGLGNVGNFKAVSTVASQGLTDTEKSNARANIGLGDASGKGVDTSITASASDNNIPTSKAVKSYVDTEISNLPEPMIFKGSLGTGGTITSLPTAAKANTGFTYKVITDGTYASQKAKVGDTFISTGSAWELIPSGDEPSGTVTSVGMTVPTGLTVTGSPVTASGTLAVSFTNGYSIPTTANQTNWNKTNYGKVKINEVSIDSGSHGDTIQFVEGTNITLSADTTNKKVTITAKDTTYSSKTAASGGTDVSLVTTGEKYTWNNKAGTSVATTSANGLMSSTDKTKLNGIATGATAVSETTVSGWGFTKNTGTVTKVKVGTSEYSPSSGVVSLPAYPTSLPASNTTDTYSSTGTVPVSGKAVASAIGGLDVTGTTAFGAGKTISAWSETDGKISITSQNISITKSQVSDFPTSMTPTAHNQASSTITAMTSYAKASSASAISTSDSLNTAIGKLEKGLDGKAASSHNQASNTINAMTGYSKASSASAISTSDSLNVAVGKLEKKVDDKVQKTEVSSANKTTSTIAITDNSQMVMVAKISGKTVKDGTTLKSAAVESVVSRTKNYVEGISILRGTLNGTTGIFSTSTTRCVTDYIAYKPLTSVYVELGSPQLYEIHEYTSSKGFLGYTTVNANTAKIITKANTAFIRILMRKPDNSEVTLNEIIGLICTDTNKTTVLVPSSVKNLPDYGLGIVKSDGTILANEVDFENGVYIRRVKKIKGSALTSGWDYNATSGGGLFWCNSPSDSPTPEPGSRRAILCSVYNGSQNTYTALQSGECSLNDGNFSSTKRILFKDSSIPFTTDGLAKIREKVVNDNVDIIYELATPETIPLADYLRPLPVENGGTLTLVNEHNLDVNSTIKYKKEVN